MTYLAVGAFDGMLVFVSLASVHTVLTPSSVCRRKTRRGASKCAYFIVGKIFSGINQWLSGGIVVGSFPKL